MGGSYFYFGMVRGNAEADEAVGDREGFVHVDMCGGELGEHTVGGVEAGWASTNDGHAKGGMAASGGEETGMEVGGQREYPVEDVEGVHWVCWFGGVDQEFGICVQVLFVSHLFRYLFQ